MQIFHYTSLNTLALILNSGALRFGRIDTMDDIRECEGLLPEHSLKLFISCWTKDPVENIVLWEMYTRSRGVRIEFPQKFYNNYFEGILPNTFISPLPLEQIDDGKGFTFAMATDDHGFWTDVEYCPDAVQRKKAMWTRTEEGISTDHQRNLVRFKDEQWRFQQEFRFWLYRETTTIQAQPSYIDIPISKEVLNNIKIRLHPNSPLHTKLITEALIEKYATNGIVEDSHLDGTVRSKKF